MAIAGVCPYSTDPALITFTVVKMTAFVFHDKYAAIREKGHEIGVEFLVRQLKPERCFLAFDIPNPEPHLIHGIEVGSAIELLARALQVADKWRIVLIKLSPSIVRLVIGI